MPALMFVTEDFRTHCSSAPNSRAELRARGVTLVTRCHRCAAALQCSGVIFPPQGCCELRTGSTAKVHFQRHSGCCRCHLVSPWQLSCEEHPSTDVYNAPQVFPMFTQSVKNTSLGKEYKFSSLLCYFCSDSLGVSRPPCTNAPSARVVGYRQGTP